MYLMLQFVSDVPFEQLRSGWYVVAFGFSIGSLILLVHIITLITTEIVITNYRFVYKTGWIARNTQEVSLSNIEEVTLRQSFWGRLFGFGVFLIAMASLMAAAGGRTGR